MNPFKKLLHEKILLFQQMKRYAYFSENPQKAYFPEITPKQKKRLFLFAPHPDDECITGGLPLRLQEENNIQVIVIAVTLGSKKERQEARLQELHNACSLLAFHLIPLALDSKTLAQRESNEYEQSVEKIGQLIQEYQPDIICFPHQDDENTTHKNTSLLIKNVLKKLPLHCSFFCIETEYWAPLKNPNLLVELSIDHVATLTHALTAHIGEITRNPYHIRLSDWMSDTVRRAELVQGSGTIAPEFNFGVMYRITLWKKGLIHTHPLMPHISSIPENLTPLFSESLLSL